MRRRAFIAGLGSAAVWPMMAGRSSGHQRLQGSASLMMRQFGTTSDGGCAT